jgi:hypothetical protein
MDGHELENKITGGITPRYRLKKTSIPFYSAVKHNHAYLILLKLVNEEKPEKYFLIKLKPRPDLEGIPCLKIKTEISRFRNFEEFYNDLRSLCHLKIWDDLLLAHEITVLHAKCDIRVMKFNQIKCYLNAKKPRSPLLLRNLVTKRRTLYISNNHYFYEKPGFIRHEIRIHKATEIHKKLKIKRFENLKAVHFHHYQFLFDSIIFKNPYRLKSKLGSKEYEIYLKFLRCLHSHEETPFRSKRGICNRRMDFFLGSKFTLNKIERIKFERKILPLMEDVRISLKSEQIAEFNKFKGESYV